MERSSKVKPMPGWQPIRPCPVCGSASHDLLYQQRFEHFAAGSITDAYDVVVCRICGMCFATGLPDEQRFAQYYADSSKYDLGAEGAQLSVRDIDRYSDQARFAAAQVVDRTVPVLDVGTATGVSWLPCERLASSGHSASILRRTRSAWLEMRSIWT